MDDIVDDPASLYAKGCSPDVVLVLCDMKGNTVCRLRAVKAILAAWSPVLRGAIELGANNSSSSGDPPTAGPIHGSNSSGCLAAYSSSNCSIIPSAGCSSPAAGMCSSGDCNTTTGSSSNSMVPQSTASPLISSSSSWAGLELPILVDGHKEVEAWKVAVCLMHPLDPTCGKTPSSLITTCVIKPLVTLADKYNLQGLLPHCKDVLLDPRSSFGVPGIHDYYQLDALDWLQIAENVPGFEAVVSRCITQIVASATSSRGRSQRMAGSLDQPRYRGHEALVSAMAGLRPETCAKVAASLCSCLAVACENMANQDRYTIRPVGDHWWGWEYQYEPLRK